MRSATGVCGKHGSELGIDDVQLVDTLDALGARYALDVVCPGEKRRDQRVADFGHC